MNTDEKVNPIIITDNESGAEYTLEFSRESVKFAEQRGFSMNDIERYPMTKLPELFYYAFRMHHKMIPREKTDKLFERMIFPKGFFERLGKLYALPLSFLAEETEEENEGENPTITVQM